MLRELFTPLFLLHYQRKGMKALREGRYAKAEAWMQKALLLSNSAESQYNLAIVYMSDGRYYEAASYLEKVLKEHPDNEMALLAHAQCQAMLRNWESALTSHCKLAEQHPANLSYQKYLTVMEDPIQREKQVCARELVLQSQKEVEKHHLEEAIRLLQEAETFDPLNAQIPNNIGAIMITLKKPDVVIIPFFEKALSLDPQNEKIKRNILYLRYRMKK